MYWKVKKFEADWILHEDFLRDPGFSQKELFWNFEDICVKFPDLEGARTLTLNQTPRNTEKMQKKHALLEEGIQS